MVAQYSDLKDKVAIVTGAARGIGKATALELAAQGVRLIIDDLPEREDLLLQTADLIKASGGDALAVIADIRLEDDIKRLIAKTIETYGQIDILVNNAGIVYDIDWELKTEEQWKDTLATNLIGPYMLMREVSTYLKQTKGSIINITSTNAYKVMNPFTLDYDASKAGLITLTHNAAKALAPDVRVNAIAPGWVDTDMNADLSKEHIQEEKAKIFKERFARAEEIATIVSFLASSSASYINGTTITADGGYQ